MLKSARRAAGKVLRAWKRQREKSKLAHLYSPDPENLDLNEHLAEAMSWLKRAQDFGVDRGVAYGTSFGEEFQASYPETTGYICQTFVDLYKMNGDEDLLNRAIEMGDWEIDIQLPDGAVMGGKVNPNPTPAVFNTGMVLLGWSSLIRATGEERFSVAARRASDWLVSNQEPDGNWIKGNSNYAKSESTLYNVKAAWGLCEAGAALDDNGFVDAATKNAEYCVSRQADNGWYPDCCLSDSENPLLHTLAYTGQGLVGIAKITDRTDFWDSAKLFADAQIEIMGNDGFLPGRQAADFSPAVDWCCVTGSAQTSIVWSELYMHTNDQKYLDAVRKVNRYLMAKHDIRNTDPRLRGGVSGAWPVWGDYGRLRILNWATKFFVDALTLERELSK